jgi:hypothetical protein
MPPKLFVAIKINTALINRLNNFLPLMIIFVSFRKASIILLKISFTLNDRVKNAVGQSNKISKEDVQLNEPAIVDGSNDENKFTIMVT